MAEQESGWRGGKRINIMPWVFVALTVLFTVYGQIVIKWQVNQLDTGLPEGTLDKFVFVFRQYLNPWIISGLLSAFIASASWIAAMTQLELSKAYPFTSLAFIIVLFLSVFFFDESLTTAKVLGTVIILVGLYIIVR